MALLDRAATALQAAALWPKGRRGGGRTTPHVGPEDLTNLMLAIACADPITAAAKAVHRYRPLVLSSVVEVQEITTNSDSSVTTRLMHKPGHRGMEAALLHQFPNTLGGRLDGLLLTASRNRTVRNFAGETVNLSFTLDDEFPEAAISFAYSMGTDLTRRTIETSRFRIAHDDDMPQRQILAAALVRTVGVPFAFFETLRDLAADTLEQTAKDPELCPSG